VAKIKVGPVSGALQGQGDAQRSRSAQRLQDIRRRRGGGVAGFAKGGATVGLTEKDGGTLLKYDVEAQIGGQAGAARAAG